MPDRKTHNGKFVLIVDDDRGTRMLEAQRLAPLGLEIRCAASAEETLGILREATPELMLLDYSLPGASAVELIGQLRKRAIPVPLFLVVTGRGDEEAAGEVLKAGASGCIIKEKDYLERLLPAVRKALAAAPPEKAAAVRSGKRSGATGAGN